MALLTADDVLKKEFERTKFREGYDQDEVDDFLDQVVDTLRKLYAENAEVKGKLAEAEQRVAELSASAARDVAMPSRPSPATPTGPQPLALPTPAMIPTQPVVKPVARESEPESATQMLALAQRLHNEYVENGREEGDRIISEARVQAAAIVREAEETSVRTMGKLEQDRSVLERKIEELKIFERDYRTRLKSYLENLLTDLDGKAVQVTPPEGFQGWEQRPGAGTGANRPFGA